MRRDFVPTAEGDFYGSTVLLTGAGCSKSAGVPLASEIAKNLCVKLATSYRLCDDESEPNFSLDKLIESKRISESAISKNKVDWSAVYEEIFTNHYRTPKETKNVFSSILDSSKVKINWTHLSIGELVRLGYVSTVLTTNFDQLILEGMAKSGRLPVVADGIESLNRITGHSTYPQLVHIHGSRHTYRLRNSTIDTEEIAKEAGAIHAIREIMQTATVFLVVGYGGRERGLMKLLIDSAKDFPDTQIFWIAHEQKSAELSSKAKEFLKTSKYSKVLYNQDSDYFFFSLLQEMGINAPKAIDDPLFEMGRLKESLAYSDNAEIRAAIAMHQQKVERIQAVFDPAAIGINRKNDGSMIDAAEAKMQAVERLATGVAHDFNNILTATLGYSDLLLLKHPEGESSYDDIIAIRNSAERAAVLVKKLFAFASSLKLNPKRSDLSKLILDLSVNLKNFVHGDVNIEYDLQRDVWQVLIDEEEMERAIVSLVENANEAIIDSGNIVVRTRNIHRDKNSEVGVLREVSSVKIEVEDDGVGINPDIGDRIFDPYFTTKPGERAGMGLSSVQGMVRQSGGEIAFRSKLGEGTTIEIYIPRYIDSRPKTPVNSFRKMDYDISIEKFGRRIVAMCVEDEASVREYTVRVLREMGIIVLVANSGNEAIKLYEMLEEKLSFVISDVAMKDGDGPTLLKKMRKKGFAEPFIMCSGYAEGEIRKIISSDLSAQFLPKPYSVGQLGRAVEKALQRSIMCENG